MAVQISAGDPLVTFDGDEFARQVATFAKANGIVDQTGYLTAVGNIAAGSALELAAVKAMLKAVKFSAPLV